MLVGNPMIYRQLPIELALAKTIDAGFDALELWPPQIAEFRTPGLRRHLADYVRDRGCNLVRLNCADRDYFQALASPSDVDRALAGLQADVDAAADLGMDQVLTWEGRSLPSAPEEKWGRLLDDTVRLFELACSYAQERGVELTVEIHPFTLGIDLEWLVALCDRLAGRPFNVTYDCCHFAVGLPQGYIAAIDRLGGRIGHVHFSDSDARSSELHFAPGTGCLDLDGVVAALQRIGFAGTMMLDLWLYPLPDEGVRIGVPYVRRAFAKRWDWLDAASPQTCLGAMQAAYLDAVGSPLKLGDLPRPALAGDEVLIETHACGICRTDIHIQDGLAYVPQLPHVPGHEPAGVICELGADVLDFRIGDRVVPHLFITCGDCVYCRSGRDAQCSRVGGIIGVTAGGGFAEYFKAPARNLLLLPDNVPFDVGGLASCAVVTAVHAYRRARVEINDAVAVLGVGGIGQILIQILRHAGARVIALARSRDSLEGAARAGAHLCVELGDSAADQVVQFADGEGAASVLECVGVAATMQTAARCVRRGGRVVVIGEEQEYPAIDTIQIAQRELEIIGSRNGSKQDAADALHWMSRGVIHPAIAERVTLAEINRGLDMVRRGGVHGRVVVMVREPR